MARMQQAPIIYVMGPSGAGKDSVLRYARERIDGQHSVAFAHRYITRAATPGDEAHIPLTPPEFALRRASGLFAMSWEAHGLHYGIGIEIEAWRRAGLAVVISGSRAHFHETLATAPDILPVLVTANRDVAGARLAARGRERGAALDERLQRSRALSIEHPRLATIDNSGPLERAGQLFVDLLVAAVKG